MNSLLLVAHGSRREQSNEEARLLVDKLKHRRGDQFPAINVAFFIAGGSAHTSWSVKLY